MEAKDCLQYLPGPLYQHHPGAGTGYCRQTAWSLRQPQSRPQCRR